MFETKLPYPVFDADNHFYDAPDAITRHLEPEFVDRGAIAVDYRPGIADRHRERIAQGTREEFPVPGSHTYKANPLRIEDPEERAKVVESFRRMAPAFQSRDNRLEVMDVQGLRAGPDVPHRRRRLGEQRVPRRPARQCGERARAQPVGAGRLGLQLPGSHPHPGERPDRRRRPHGRRARPHAGRRRARGAPAAGTAQRAFPGRPVLRPLLGAHRRVGRARRRAPQLHEVPARQVPISGTTRTRTTSTASTRSSGSRTGATARSWRRSPP